MYKYNVTGLHGLRLGRCLLISTALIASACATAPESPAPAQSAVEPPATAPRSTNITVAKDDARSARAPVVAQTPRRDLGLREDAPLRYVVKKGDTLWDISSYFLNDPFYWPELWFANPDIENPHLIFPGDVLYLVYIDGRPQLRRTPLAGGGERLSPRVRVLPIEDAIPTIPLDAIQQFLNGPRLVTEQELENAPYIVDFSDQHLVGGAGNVTYVRRANPGEGNVFNVVRPGPAYIDPQTDEILGYEAAPIGDIAIREYADISTGVLTRTYREALPGDRLLPLETVALATNFYPRAPEQNITGQVISVYGGVAQIGQYQIITLNRGRRDEVERGHVLDIYQTGRGARDPITGERVTLPPVKAGTLLVFKVEERVSFGLVMRATRAIHVLDSVRNPN